HHRRARLSPLRPLHAGNPRPATLTRAMPFPTDRPRRMRRTAALRRLVRETRLRPDDLIHPAFVREDLDAPREIPTMPGQHQAAAGADVIAPSGMMDGQVAAIRQALDDAGFAETAILAYSAKYASVMYGPFRDAADCAPKHGDRRGYQMDVANQREAVRETLLDIEEGADMVMVKPALTCLDVVARVRDATDLPLAAYCVSGEYAMLRAAAAAGAFEE